MTELKLPGYSIFLQNNWLEMRRFLTENNRFSQIAVVCDENTARFCLPVLEKKIGHVFKGPIVIPAGEAAKNLATCESVWRAFLEKKLDRNGLVVLLGGGVVGDLGGFAAATWKRGIPFVQMPTTLLSMVDSSIGGKLGIDFEGIKNSVGVFQDPRAVFICPDFLATLPARELRSGFAEMAKHALIASETDWEFFKNAPKPLDLDWPNLLENSLLVKKAVVEKDPFEQGPRKTLNFGHTIGHAIESHFLTTENPLLHGEAIAIGMVCESWLSWKTGGISKKELDGIAAFFIKIFGKTDWPRAENTAFLETMRHDKKNAGGEIRFALLKKIGLAHWDISVADAEILDSLRYYQRL